MARVSLVSCINLFGANQLNSFSEQLGADQIIWCAAINYLNYLVRVKSFGAHQFISYSSWTRKTCDNVASCRPLSIERLIYETYKSLALRRLINEACDAIATRRLIRETYYTLAMRS